MFTNKQMIGKALPFFEAKDSKQRLVTSLDFKGNWLVLFFYPKNETSVCTKEACSFRDSYAVFTDLGVEVVGISKDSSESHSSFQQNHSLPYPLLSDSDGKIREKLGIKKTLGILDARETYVVDPEGFVRHVFRGALASDQHVQEALDFIIQAKKINLPENQKS